MTDLAENCTLAMQTIHFRALEGTTPAPNKALVSTTFVINNPSNVEIRDVNIGIAFDEALAEPQFTFLPGAAAAVTPMYQDSIRRLGRYFNLSIRSLPKHTEVLVDANQSMDSARTIGKTLG